jgi:hypothetical protein
MVTGCACAVVFASGLIAVTAFSPAIQHQLAISFVRQPDRYTELYFSDNEPVTLRKDLRSIVAEVRFKVRSHEGDQTAYHCRAVALDKALQVIGQSVTNASVQDGDTASVIETVRLSPRDSAALRAIQVTLDGRVERLTYVMPPGRDQK